VRFAFEQLNNCSLAEFLHCISRGPTHEGMPVAMWRLFALCNRHMFPRTGDTCLCPYHILGGWVGILRPGGQIHTTNTSGSRTACITELSLHSPMSLPATWWCCLHCRIVTHRKRYYSGIAVLRVVPEHVFISQMVVTVYGGTPHPCFCGKGPVKALPTTWSTAEIRYRTWVLESPIAAEYEPDLGGCSKRQSIPGSLAANARLNLNPRSREQVAQY
jgi:hypothetical protein